MTVKFYLRFQVVSNLFTSASFRQFSLNQIAFPEILVTPSALYGIDIRIVTHVTPPVAERKVCWCR